MTTIVIPIDYSEVANGAARYALAMAKSSNSKFVFFHAGKNEINKLKDHIHHIIPDIDLYTDRVRYVTTDDDFTVDSFIKAINMQQASLVVMGTHGEKTPLTPAVFGSNTAAAIEELNIPVLAVPPGFTYKGISHIVYAADLTYLYKELERVVGFAKMVSAAIDIVHVTPVFPDIYDTEKTDVDEVIEKIKSKHSFPYIKYFVEETKYDNQTEKGIHNYIQTHSPDLLALFHISRSWIDKIITPSTAVREIWHIKIPVIVFPKMV